AAGIVVRARPVLQALGREQQHRPRNGRLPLRHFVEILEGPHLRPRELTLECLVGALDARYELRDFVVLRDGLRRDLLAFPVKAADEADFVEHFRSRIAHKVKDPVLLAYARRKHRVFPDFTLLFITLSPLFAAPCGPGYPPRR